ncbi:BON domain-containing protein [Phyllobacterium meliloti]|uniref:BON domain-containing protein n=1 Tax=Phyllobacterium meliloti TaxID=555317 RepID=UPI000DE09427|nr:BON domain-containing protein [Phyllobacterium sp. T1293]UGX87919.1 BON domain-containing protein [Phyllobacterium sp. T1293]
MHIVKSWFWPGIITVACLTTLAGWFLAEPVDRQLTEAVSTALEVDNGWASIEVEGRDLTLKGVAPSEEALASALKIANETNGIRVVENAATLLPLIDPFSFVVTKSDQGILLSGNVPYGDTRAKLLAAAENAMPGIDIIDEMAVARGAPKGFIELANFALQQASQLVSGEVSLAGESYSIDGTAANAADYESITNALKTQLPGNGKVGDVKLAPPAASNAG